MYLPNSNDYNNINFGALIRVSDKRLLKLPHKTSLLQEASPLDFFYRESPAKRKLDSISDKIRAYIRDKQRKPENLNSEFRTAFWKKSYLLANRLRTVASKFLALSNFRNFIKSGKLINNLDVNSPQYVEEWAKIGNSVNDKFLNINIEDGIIEKLAQAKDSSIFILNHDNFERDKFIYPIFNSFLNYGYAAMGRQNDCPRPAIVVSKNFFKLVGDKFKKLYQKMGLIPVDASLSAPDTRSNFSPMMGLVSKFARNKVNIFIFPEGNNSIYKHKSLQEKFQQGIARMIIASLYRKSSVRVVPLGLAYDTKPNNMGSVFIENPINFVKSGKFLHCTTEDGKILMQCNLSDKALIPKIVQILCRNLQQGIEKSKAELAK